MAMDRHKLVDYKDMLVLDFDTLEFFDGAQKREPLLHDIFEFDDGFPAIFDEWIVLLVVGVNQLGGPVDVLVDEGDDGQLKNLLYDADLFQCRERLVHKGGVSLFNALVNSGHLLLIW